MVQLSDPMRPAGVIQCEGMIWVLQETQRETLACSSLGSDMWGLLAPPLDTLYTEE